MSVPYYQVNSFTEQPFTGNPAGVCLLPAFLPDAAMLRIAAENRHSQTAFVVPRRDGDFDLRWFTPTVEDDLCGHATLASAYVLALRGHAAWPVHFHTRGGVLSVAHDSEDFTMEFPAWPPKPCTPPPDLLPALGVMRARVMKARDYLVVVDDEQQVRSLAPDLRALAQIEIGLGGVIVTAPGHDGVDYVVRFFAPSVGIDEDPVTGSITCTLAPYWSERLGKRVLRGRQISKRGGELRAETLASRVNITGRACLYLQGTLEVGNPTLRMASERLGTLVIHRGEQTLTDVRP